MAKNIKRTLIAAQTALLFANSACFVLREYEGKIALFQENEPQPIAVYDTPPDALYPADAELLREGIRVKSEGEITRLIEDLDLEYFTTNADFFGVLFV